MSEKDLDKLFRNKLQKAAYQPGEDAWLKVQNRIKPVNNSRKFYLGIAASLVIIFTMGWLLGTQWDTKENRDSLSNADSNTETPTDQQKSEGEKEAEKLTTTTPAENQVAENTTDVTEKETNSEFIPEKSKGKPNSEIQKEMISEATTSKTKTEKKNEVVASEKNNTAESKQSEASEVIEKRIEANPSLTETIAVNDLNKTAKAETETPKLNTKATDEKVVAEEQNATEEEAKRGFSLRKVLEVAKDLKTDTDAWATLREAKNEFFSFGRNDKPDTQE